MSTSGCSGVIGVVGLQRTPGSQIGTCRPEATVKMWLVQRSAYYGNGKKHIAASRAREKWGLRGLTDCGSFASSDDTGRRRLIFHKKL